MTFVLRFLFLYLLDCEDCGKRRLALGHDNALAACYQHDNRCPIQVAQRLGQASSKIDQLVDTWRAAADRYQRLESRWSLVRWAFWPATAAAMVLIATGSHALIPAVLTVAALVFAFAYTERLRAADQASARAWDAIRDYTSLSGDEVARLVGLDWDGNHDEEEQQ